MKFNVGAVVVLKSGSPKMTVAHYEKLGNGRPILSEVVCIWFVNGEQKKGTFHEDTLTDDIPDDVGGGGVF